MIEEILEDTEIGLDLNDSDGNGSQVPVSASEIEEVRTIRKLNEELARTINEEARANPQSPYAGKFVGLANGKVVVVANDWDEVACQLGLAEADPAKTFAIEASRDYNVVEEIWGIG